MVCHRMYWLAFLQHLYSQLSSTFWCSSHVSLLIQLSLLLWMKFWRETVGVWQPCYFIDKDKREKWLFVSDKRRVLLRFVQTLGVSVIAYLFPYFEKIISLDILLSWILIWFLNVYLEDWWWLPFHWLFLLFCIIIVIRASWVVCQLSCTSLSVSLALFLWVFQLIILSSL